jgi:hypothetical protein
MVRWMKNMKKGNIGCSSAGLSCMVEKEGGQRRSEPQLPERLGNTTNREGRMVAESTQMMEIIVQEMEEGMEETRRRGKL